MREYCPSGMPGFSADLLANPRALRVHKIASHVTARRASQLERVSTREGPAPAHPGDFIVTAATGEQWPVAGDAFARRYRPAGAPGEYCSVPHDSLALFVDEPFAVVLADGVARLYGQPGDWLLDYGDGSMGVVAADIFPATYQLLD